ncbi:MAG: PAS domain-containing protein, partial [Clostridiales bacterium]|nr:PAS domain-containing protein [Clostridiales bacterium]
MRKDNGTEKQRPAAGRTLNKIRISSVIFILIVALLDGFYLYLEWKRCEEIVASEAITLAHSLQSLLHTEHITELKGSPADLNTAGYNLAKEDLMRLAKNNSIIQSAYLLNESDGNIVFLVDSEPHGSPDFSLPGEIYDAAAENYWELLSSGETMIVPQANEGSKSLVSVFVPLKEYAGDGNVIAVLGIDYRASDWLGAIWKNLFPDIIIAACFLMLCMSLVKILEHHFRFKELNRRLMYNEALYRSIFEQAPVGIAIVNDKTFVNESVYGRTVINRAFENILGRTKEELAGVRWP